jgi:uncharacterized repeat protein (TIGR01451 family)
MCITRIVGRTEPMKCGLRHRTLPHNPKSIRSWERSSMPLRLPRLLAIALFVVSTFSVAADTFTLVLTGGNWSSNTIWLQNGLPAVRYPGSLVGTTDTVNIVVSLYTVNVDVALAERVELHTTCPSNTSTCVVSVNAGGALPLTGTSTIGNDAHLKLNGGSIDNVGTLDFTVDSRFDWLSGTLSGAGTTNIAFDSTTPAVLTIANGTLDTQTLVVAGKAAHTGSWAVNNGAQVQIPVNGIFDVQSVGAITTNNAATSKIVNAGTFEKTAGPGGTNISVPLNNNGIVKAWFNSLVLSDGTHNGGTFDVASGCSLEIAGTFTGTCAIQGAGTTSVVGTPVVANGAILTVQNITMAGGWIQGPVSGSAMMDVSGTVTFNGGVWRRNLTVNMLTGSTLNVTGTASALITDAATVVNDSGAVVQFSAGTNAVINSGSVITNNGTLRLFGDVTIDSDGVGGARIDNNNILVKNSGAGVAVLNVALNNDSSASTTSGSLRLTRSGAHTGSFSSCGGCFVAFAGGIHDLNSGAGFTGLGSVKLSSGTVNVNSPVTSSAPFVLEGGTLSGPQSFSITGTTLWTGGTMSGSGMTSFGNTASLTGATAAMILSGRTLKNSSTLTYSPTGLNLLSIESGATLTNNGTFDITGDFNINTSGATATFINGGTVSKSGGAGIARIACAVDNNSTISVTSGQLALNGGGTNAGLLTLPLASNELVFETGIYTLAAGTTVGVNDNGWIRVSGATLTLSAPLTLKRVQLVTGFLTGSPLTIDTALKWNGGTILGPGTTTIANTASVDLSALTSQAVLDNRTLDSSATSTYNAGTFGLQLTNGAIWNNNAGASFVSTGDGAVTSGAGTNVFNNASLAQLRKTGGVSGTRFDVVVNNNGGSVTSEVVGQSLIINGGGSMSGGSLASNAGALFDFFGGTFTISGGTLLSGTFRVLGTATLAIQNSTSTSTAVELHSGGTIDVLTSKLFAIDDFTWKGGTVQGGGQTHVTTGSLTNAAPAALSGSHTFEVLTSFNYGADAANFLTIGTGATFLVTGTGALDLTTDAPLSGTGLVQNLGAIKKNGGSGISTIAVPVSSTAGSIGAATGTLRFTGGGTLSSTAIPISGGSFVEINAGAMNIATGSTITGTGTFLLSGGTVNFNTAITIPTFSFTGGALGGNGAVTLHAGKWTGGDMVDAGTTLVGSGKTFEIATGTPKKLRRAFTNDGTVLFMNLPAAMTLENAAVFTNNSLVELQENTNFFCTCAPTPSTFRNAAGATLRQSTAAGTSNFLTLFDNDGTVDLQTGILNLLNGGSHTGTFTVGAPTFLSFAGASDSFSPASSITGSGAAGFGAATSTFAGSYNITGTNALTVVQGGVTFNSASVIQTSALEMRSGSIGGSAAIHITGGSSFDSSWQAGTISGSGAFTIGSGALFDINASSAPVALNGRTLTNSGTIRYTSATNTLTFLNGASIANGGLFDIQSDTAIASGVGTNTVTNSGTFKKTVATGPTSFGPAFTNSNTVSLISGTIDFTGGFTQTAGSTVLGGGAMGGSVALNGGSLSGNGTITGNVTNAASVLPGASPGVISIIGNYTQTSTGGVSFDLSGTTPATQHDQLIVTGTAALGGTLNVVLFGGYVPNDGDVFDVLTFASKTGDFATKNLPTFPSGGAIEANYLPAVAPTKLQLAAVTTQSDIAVSQTTSGPALHNDNVTFTVKVKNFGPDTATGVALNDTFTNATFGSVATTVGSCSGTGPIACSVGTLTAGQEAIVTIVLQATTIGNISNTVDATSTTFDSTLPNNDVATVTVSAAANVGVTISDAADPVSPGATVVYTVTVTNVGPDPSAPANVAISIANGSILTASSASFTCTGSGATASCTTGSLGVGTHSITVNTQAPPSGVMTLSANASSTTTTDPQTANNSDTESTTVVSVADLSIAKNGPSTASSGDVLTYTISIKNSGPASAVNVVVTDPRPAHTSFLSTSGACTTTFPCNLGTLASGQTRTITATYRVSPNSQGRTITNVATIAADNTDPLPSNNSASATTTIACEHSAPVAAEPAQNATVPISGNLTWSGSGDSYVVYLGPAGSGCSAQFATTDVTSLAYSLDAATTYEWRVESIVDNCPTVSSSCRMFTTEAACSLPQAPLARVVAQTTTNNDYAVDWNVVPGAVRYEIDEATNEAFTGAHTIAVNGLSHTFQHEVSSPTAFFYRVRAFTDCLTEAGPNSLTVRVVILPLPAQGEPRDINVPVGSHELIVQQVFVPGEPNQSLFFQATTDRPWVTVQPSSGVLPPSGVTLQVTTDPTGLPNGTFTASLIVALTETSGVRSNATTNKTFPLPINIVTPVSPVPTKDAASQYAMVIPSVGHIDGINSHWQSDIRVTNAGFQSTRYRLTFTPSGGTAQGVKQTIITVDAGATTALDDIIRNWYGIGALGESALGMLEILPLDDPAVTSASTVASSRTYNVTGAGTLGQFIPAVRYSSFVGQAVQGALPQLLSLQQIAQTADYRTNVGVAEASGAPASVVLRFFNGLGAKVLEMPVQLAGGEQRQLNSLLSRNGIQLADGRVEMQVVGGTGKVTAYASVIDNHSGDPLLVSGTPLTQSGFTKWVLPGAANLDNPLAHWRTDLRIFNYGVAPQTATLTFFPMGSATGTSAEVALDGGRIVTLDNVVRSLFGGENVGGVVHLATAVPSQLIVTGRTYNDTPAGTFGQFIPAITPDIATGAGERTLHILQVEDSVRYRTNVGIAEVSGKPVTVELQVVLPDTKVTPTIAIPLAANEFRQFAVIRALGLGNVYNARITLRVIGGEGRVTAYGSVIDETTQDPTYVPAQ